MTRLIYLERLSDATDKSSGIKFRAKDLIGAIGMDRDAPVADEGDELAVLSGLDLGAEALCFMYGVLALYIDEDEVKVARPEGVERFLDVTGGVDFKAGQTEDLVAQGAEGFALADVQNALLFLRGYGGIRHESLGEAWPGMRAGVVSV